jgi:D-glycero-alpha-D-manno-heptose-7-phosphate kinase
MLAETAYSIEANLCGHPVGKQDQYAAAYGGFHYYGFSRDGKVQVQPIGFMPELFEQMMLFWTGKTRSANEILESQKSRLKSNDKAIRAGIETLHLAECMTDQLEQYDYSDLGKMLHLAWKTKKAMNPEASSEDMDALYSTAIKAGATGGKLCGAGGGGFFLFIVPPEKQESVREKLKLRQVKFNLEQEGSKVIYYAKT